MKVFSIILTSLFALMLSMYIHWEAIHIIHFIFGTLISFVLSMYIVCSLHQLIRKTVRRKILTGIGMLLSVLLLLLAFGMAQGSGINSNNCIGIVAEDIFGNIKIYCNSAPWHKTILNGERERELLKGFCKSVQQISELNYFEACKRLNLQ